MLLAMSNQGRARTAIPVEVKDYFNGINLWDFFIEKTGRAPRTGESVQLTIPKGTRIFGASGGSTAITIDNRWGATSSVRIDNYGEIIGGGGNGGRGAMYFGREWSLGNPYYVLKAQNGGNGGIGVSSTVPVDIRNHNLVSGGGGGGGGSPAWSVGYLSRIPGSGGRYNNLTIDRFGKYHWFNEEGGGGGGGGAPFGDFHHNLGHFAYVLKHHPNNTRMVQYANTIMKHMEISCDDLAVRPGERHTRSWAMTRNLNYIQGAFTIRTNWQYTNGRKVWYGTMFDWPIPTEYLSTYTIDPERFNPKFGYDFTVDDATELLKLCYGLDGGYSSTNNELVDSLAIWYRAHPEYWRTRRLLTNGNSPSSGMIHDDYLDKNRYAFYAYEDDFGGANTPRWSHELRMEYIPTSATDKKIGLGGINMQTMGRAHLSFPTRNEDDWVNDPADPRFIRPSNSGIDAMRGGNGGGYGENGGGGIINKIEYIYYGNKQDGSIQHGTAKLTLPLPLTEQDQNVFIVPGGKGGLAGKVFEGPVRITNYGSGITKGRA